MNFFLFKMSRLVGRLKTELEIRWLKTIKKPDRNCVRKMIIWILDDPVLEWSLYSEPPNTRLSGIRMVIFRTLFVSSIWMVLGAILLKNIQIPDFFVRFSNGGTIWKPDRTFLTASLDRFGKKNSTRNNPVSSLVEFVKKS
jgi:hypothetical protein